MVILKNLSRFRIGKKTTDNNNNNNNIILIQILFYGLVPRRCRRFNNVNMSDLWLYLRFLTV